MKKIVSKPEQGELYYSPQQLATRWSKHARTIRDKFRDYPEVIKIEGVTGRTWIRVPHSVVTTCKYEQRCRQG